MFVRERERERQSDSGRVLDISAAMSWRLHWDGDPAKGQCSSRSVFMRPVPLQHSHYTLYPDIPPVLYFNVKKL